MKNRPVCAMHFVRCTATIKHRKWGRTTGGGVMANDLGRQPENCEVRVSVDSEVPL